MVSSWVFGMPNMSSLLYGLALEHHPFLFICNIFLWTRLSRVKNLSGFFLRTVRKPFSSSFNISPTFAFPDSPYEIPPPFPERFLNFLVVPRYFRLLSSQPLRVANSKTMNRTRLMDFLIIDGDCLRRLVRIILVKRELGKMRERFFFVKLMILIRSLLRSLMMFVA